MDLMLDLYFQDSNLLAHSPIPHGSFEQVHCSAGKEDFVKFLFSKKATKIDKIFTVDLTLFSKCQIDGEDFVNFFGLLRKHELYIITKQML